MLTLQQQESLDQLGELNPDALLADGLEAAYIGYVVNHHHETVAVYDIAKCRDVLMEDGATYEEAEEYLSFNTLGAYVGPHGPLFINPVGAA